MVKVFDDHQLDISFMDLEQGPSPPPKEPAHDENTYSSTKGVSQNLLNISIIQGYIQSLVLVFANDDYQTGFGIALIVFVGLSFIMQAIMFFLVTFLMHVKRDYKRYSNLTAVGLNSLVTFLSLCVVIDGFIINYIAIEMNLTNRTLV